MSVGATNVNAATNPLLAALVTDSRWSVSTIEYAFAPGGTRYDDGEGRTPTSEAFTAAERQWIRDEMAEISTVAALSFTQVSYQVSSLDFVKEQNIGGGTSGYAFLPEGDYSQVVLDSRFIRNDGTAIHEIGHALGLDHPFDGTKLPGVRNDASAGQFTLNNALYTRMAYNDASIHGATAYILPEVVNLAALDIAALQVMYGANTTHRNGNDVYSTPTDTMAIWDTGGIDRIDFRAETDATVIDLRAATLRVEEGGGGWASYATTAGSNAIDAAFTIAYGVTVENGFGGQGDDDITGNAAANILLGGAGNDALDGGAGRDKLFGGSGADMLVGGAGADVLNGGAGADTLEGGGGADRAHYANAAVRIIADLQFADRNTGEARGDTYDSVERLYGSIHNDSLRGDDGANVLWGHRGNDALWGRAGNDHLRGDAGNDRLIGGTGNDLLVGGAGSDTFVFTAGSGADRVADYDAAADTLRIEVAGLDFDDLTIADSASGARVDFGSGTITLLAVDKSALTADDFDFV